MFKVKFQKIDDLMNIYILINQTFEIEAEIHYAA